LNNKISILRYDDNDIYQSDVTIKICALVEKNKNWVEHSVKLDYDIWIVKSGQVQIKTKNDKVVLNEGDIYVFFPDVEYEACCLTDSCSFIFTHFDFKIGYNNRALEIYNINTYFENYKIKSQVDLFLDIFNEFEQKKSVPFLTLKGYLLILLARLIQLKGKTNEQASEHSKPLIKLLPALDYIAQNLTSQISVQTLSDLVYLSEKYFCTLFKKTFNVSPMKYIADIKLNKALEYIYEGQLSIKDIGVKLGYTDQFIFSKAFKKKFGISPSSIMKVNT